MGPCCCTICKYKSSSAYKIFKHRICKGSSTVSVEPLEKLVHWSKPAYFLKMYSILRPQTSLAAREPTAPMEKTILISAIPFCLPHLKGFFPYKHAFSVTIYILCIRLLTFFRPPSHSSEFSGLSTSSTHGEQYIYGSKCCCSPPRIFTYTKTAAPPTTELLLPIHR